MIDGDEGFYLVAARLVSDGHNPYADFFYPQMPLLPYLYGGWFAALGPAWYTARVLAGLVAAGIAVLVFELARRATGRRSWALVAAFLYVACGYTVGWYTVAKTYGFTALLLMAGLLASPARAPGRPSGPVCAWPWRPACAFTSWWPFCPRR